MVINRQFIQSGSNYEDMSSLTCGQVSSRMYPSFPSTKATCDCFIIGPYAYRILIILMGMKHAFAVRLNITKLGSRLWVWPGMRSRALTRYYNKKVHHTISERSRYRLRLH